MKCTNCGKEVSETANVCGYCGHRLKSTSLPVESHPVPPIPKSAATLSEDSVPRKRPAPSVWIFLTVIFGLILIVFAALQILPKLNSTPLTASMESPTAVNQNGAINQQQSLSPEVPLKSLLVEPYYPDGSYPSAPVLNASFTTSPGSQTQVLTVKRDQPVVILFSWCAAKESTLGENWGHISYTVVVDDQPYNVIVNGKQVDMSIVTFYDSSLPHSAPNAGICTIYSGLIRQWTGTDHTIVISMKLDEDVNDGWNNYPAGDYSNIFNVTVTQ